MSDTSPATTNWLTGAAQSPYLPIILGLVRGVVGIASGFGFAWATSVSGDQITMVATAIVAVGMLGWSMYQKIADIRANRRTAVASAVASAQHGVPVVVTETPPGQPNVATKISATEQAAAPSVPQGTPLSPAPVGA